MKSFAGCKQQPQSSMERCSTRNDENATADPSTPSATADSVGMTPLWESEIGGGREFSGQSSMERCSTRNHENATADPSTPSATRRTPVGMTPLWESEIGGGREFSGQILRLRCASLRMTVLFGERRLRLIVKFLDWATCKLPFCEHQCTSSHETRPRLNAILRLIARALSLVLERLNERP